MVPYNLMKEDGKAAYLDTGTWANKAIKEADILGETIVVESSKTRIIITFLKDIQFLMMQTISLYLKQHYFWDTNEGLSIYPIFNGV